MSIRTKHGDEIQVRFEGAVLCDREENYHDDSDFYAVVWDDDAGELRRVNYATTRFPTDENSASVDATEDVRRKARTYLYKWARPLVRQDLEAQRRRIEKGDVVQVVRGRKVPKGAKGELFWMREQRYGRKVVVRAGIRVGPGRDDVVWTYLHNLEKVDVEPVSDSQVRRLAWRVAAGERFELPFVRRGNVWV